MIIVEGHVRMENAGDFENVRAAAESQIAASKAEGGCIDYTYAIDVLDPVHHARAGAVEKLGRTRGAFQRAAYGQMARSIGRRENV